MTVFGQLGNKQRPSSPIGNVYHLLKAIIWWSEHVAFSMISRGTNRDIFASNVSNFWKQYPGAWNWVHPQVILKCENLSLQLQRNPITRKPWPPSASWWPGFSWPNIFVEKWKKKRPPLAAINCFGDSYLNISKKICIDGVEIPSLSISAGYWP